MESDGTMAIENEVLTVMQAADLCSVSRATIWRWIKNGQLPAAATAGGHHRIHSEDLMLFIKRKRMDLRVRGDNGIKRILIVDDDQKIYDLLRKVLTGCGYEVDNASDGFEAGIQIMRFQPHLVILDLYMPKMDGFEVCQRLKTDKDTKVTKIIAISGYNTAENRRRILACGADLFMAKPLDLKTLIREVSGLLTWNG